MNYFVTAPRRQGTCYHEFWRGKWDGVSFWAADSILLHDDVLSEYGESLAEALLAVIPNYAPYGVAEVTHAQWEAVGARTEAAGGTAAELYREADAWAQEVFRTHDCFTILGI